MTEQISALPPPSSRNVDATLRHVDPDAPEELPSYTSNENFSFDDVLSSLNPMHHIPVVSTIYQAVSGDRIGTGPRMMGAVLLGGPVGLIIAGISAFIEEMSGGTVADHAVALFEEITGDGDAEPADVIAQTPAAGEEGAEIVDASALADVAAAQPNLAGIRNFENLSAEKLAAVAPILRGAISPSSLNSEISSLKTRGDETHDSESKRSSQSLLHAQRAQAELLLASLHANDTIKSRPNGERDRSGGDEDNSHTNLRPAGTGPIWYADAMQRALDKYRTGPVGSNGTN